MNGSKSSSSVRASFVIPCYNREKILSATLDCVLRQTVHNWEAIVIDDGSVDRSLEVARSYQLRDPRVRVMQRQGSRQGANICRNQGLTSAAGDYIILLDSDDLISPTCLEHRIAAMDSNPFSDFGVYQTEIFNEQIGDRGMLGNSFNDSNDLHRFLSFDAVWHTSGPIWRKEMIQALDGFDTQLLSFQDWDLHVRALMTKPKYFKVSIRDHFYRMGNGSGNAIAMRSSNDPDHLRSHERLFEKTLVGLRNANMLDEEARPRLAGLFWWLATRYRVNVSVSEACRTWRKAYGLALISTRHYAEGVVINRLASVRGGRHIGRLFQMGWPAHYHRYYSKEFHATPVSSLNAHVIRSG
jgi:glycosyltransferase involved in cell wall biosynthesis